MKALIQKLVETTGPSGYEDVIRGVIENEIKAYASDIRVDPLGNLIARIGEKKEGGKRIMLPAHMDEIGLIATHIDDNGFIRFTSIGGVRAASTLGNRVRFMNGVQGVIGSERASDPGKVIPLTSLFIDVGATSKEDCPIKVGDVASFNLPMLDLGKRLSSKAMDDRVAVAVLIETLKQIKSTPNELYFVFSVQEEVGLRGATTSAYDVDPEIGISVDVTLTGDTPKGVKMEVGLGKGPTVKVRDGGMLSDPRLVRLLSEEAESQGIPYQLEILEGGTTDARAMQVTRAGVPVCCVSVPCRYVHSQVEMVDIDDVENAVKLLVSFLSKPVALP